MPPHTPTTRRSSRPQTSPTVLGKRSISATQLSTVSAMMLTPDATPKPKRARFQALEDEDDENEENIPPSPSTDGEVDTPTKARSTHRNRDHQLSPSSVVATPRNCKPQIQILQTPATSLGRLSLTTPPPTPFTRLELHARVRSLVRATSNSTENMSMNGRENERQIIEAFLHGVEYEASSNAIEPVLYISGSPGTGKTALVNSILASTPMSSTTRIVFVNCMALNNVDALWERLGEEIYGPIVKGRGKGMSKNVYDRDSVTRLLEKEKTIKCILILDELDHLSSNTALQPLIHISVRLPHTLRLLGIANTHTLSSASTLLPYALTACEEHIKTLHFAPYTPSQLLAILWKRLEPLTKDEGIGENVKKMLPVPALTLLTKKVAAVTGDVRVLFEVLRGAIDLAVSSCPSSKSDVEPKISITPIQILSALKSYTPSGGSSSSVLTPSSSAKPSGVNSEIATKVRSLGLQARLVILSLLLASKRTTQSLPIISSGSSSTFPSPTKRPAVKRTQSASSSTFSHNTLAQAQSIDTTQLHAFYSALLRASDTFAPASRSDFADLLGVLETVGLLQLSAASSSSSGTGGARTPKRTSSFAGRSKSGASAAQTVRLHSGVRESEVARGLGIEINKSTDSLNSSSLPGGEPDVDADVREETVRVIWEREMAKMRRELKARAVKMDEEERGVEIGFEDAEED